MSKKIRISLNLTISEIDILITELEITKSLIEDDDSEINNLRIMSLEYLIKRFHKAYFNN